MTAPRSLEDLSHAQLVEMVRRMRGAYSDIRDQVVRVRGWEDDSDPDEQSNWNVYTRLLGSLDDALAETPDE